MTSGWSKFNVSQLGAVSAFVTFNLTAVVQVCLSRANMRLRPVETPSSTRA